MINPEMEYMDIDKAKIRHPGSDGRILIAWSAKALQPAFGLRP
jgi:hypothetical protein